MKQKKWRGTALFVMVLMVLGLTVGLRLYGSGLQTATVATTTTAPQSSAASPATPAPSGTTAPQSPKVATTTTPIDGSVGDSNGFARGKTVDTRTRPGSQLHDLNKIGPLTGRRHQFQGTECVGKLYESRIKPYFSRYLVHQISTLSPVASPTVRSRFVKIILSSPESSAGA